MRLKIDLSELDFAFDNTGGELHWFLDRHTGAVLFVTDETQRDLERLYEELDRADPLSAEELDAALEEHPPLNSEIAAMHEANLIEADDGTRFLPLPHHDSREGYRDMEEFIDTLPPGHLQDQLWRAIRGRGAFRRFKDELLDAPAEQQHWFTFRDARQRARVLDWLAAEGIEPE